jgi:hypothetical protein
MFNASRNRVTSPDADAFTDNVFAIHLNDEAGLGIMERGN